MELFWDNFEWINLNIGLAVIGVVLGWLFYIASSKVIKLGIFMLWLLFVPNTLYLVTDIQHLREQLNGFGLSTSVALTAQFVTLVILGIMTYLLAVYPFDLFIRKQLPKSYRGLRIPLLVFLNFSIGLAIILGKVERTHSWYVFTNLDEVVADIMSLVNTPVIFLSGLMFGVLANFIYFGFGRYLTSPKKR